MTPTNRGIVQGTHPATNPSRLRTLILTLAYPHRVSYYDDWRDAFLDSSDFSCDVVSILDLKAAALARMIEDYDAIIMLHSCNNDTLDYVKPIAAVLGDRKRPKLLTFVGNEFNSPYLSTPERVAVFAESRCDYVATQLLAEAGVFVYSGTGACVISVPHGLNPRAFQPGPTHTNAMRRIDIGVKGYRYPPYLGDDDRNRLLGYISSQAPALGLNVDISEDKRFSRDQWAKFLQDCCGTISTETGGWYLERDDALINRIAVHLASKRGGLTISNKSVVRRLARRLPSAVKAVLWTALQKGPVGFDVLDDFSTPFSELDDLFFRHATRAPVYSKAISSRHFDAIGTKTCQIMLRGRFNDILVPDQHYLAVEPDYSNADDVIRRFKDVTERQRIVDNAYDFVMAGHTYADRARMVHEALTSGPS
jgi:Glycosyl transferases group 1